jgi:hypothetical protein
MRDDVCRRYLPADFSATLDIGCAAGLRQRSQVIFEIPLESFVPSKRYHLITLFDVLEHLPDINGDFSKLNSMLDKNGIIALVTPNFASMQRRIFGRRWFQFKPREHLYYFTPKRLRLLAEKHGFAIIHLSNSGQFADYDFLNDRFTKYKFVFLKKLFSAACTILNIKNKFWHVNTGSMFAVLREKNQ